MPLILKAFLIDHSTQWKRATLRLLNEDTEPFTHQYLQKKYNPDVHNPVDFARGEFHVKIPSISKVKCYSTSNRHTRVPIEDLLNQHVELVVTPTAYDYKGRQGWNLKLHEIWAC